MTGRSLLAFALFATAACGGTTDRERPEPPPPAQAGVTGECTPILPLSDRPDPGSQFVDCDALDGFEIFLINDFESQHRPDLYFNNDRTADQDPKPDAQGVPTTPIPGAPPAAQVPGQSDVKADVGLYMGLVDRAEAELELRAMRRADLER